ncbi:MAG: hypothetical protein AAGF89_14505, partial [Bacteroidota bacterium]
MKTNQLSPIRLRYVLIFFTLLLAGEVGFGQEEHKKLFWIAEAGQLTVSKITPYSVNLIDNVSGLNQRLIRNNVLDTHLPLVGGGLSFQPWLGVSLEVKASAGRREELDYEGNNLSIRNTSVNISSPIERTRTVFVMQAEAMAYLRLLRFRRGSLSYELGIGLNRMYSREQYPSERIIYADQDYAAVDTKTIRKYADWGIPFGWRIRFRLSPTKQ